MTTTETLTLSAFLTARIDEDAAVARAAQAISDGPWLPDKVYDDVRAMNVAVKSAAYGVGHDVRLPHETAEHIARHDPARVLAEVEARRALLHLYVEGYAPEYVVALFAAAHADHPDYREEFRP